MDPKRHWESVYQTKRSDEVSWYRLHLDVSLELISSTLGQRDARIVDVGGGQSTLIDDLLAAGYRDLDVLDLSETALAVTRSRLADAGNTVRWLQGDVTTYAFDAHAYDLWHDRAVFHFLTEAAQRQAYVRQVIHAVKPGGHVIVATFGPHGPMQCSGLNVVRYDADALHGEFGERFSLVAHRTEDHTTPGNRQQQFVYCLCRTTD
jgi:SAM-dependent methyltransferase